MTKFFSGMLLAFSLIISGVAEVHAKDKQPDQLEQCGAFVRTAPFCGEAVEADTRQLQALQMRFVALNPERSAEWAKLHREKRRGISYIETGEDGKKAKAGRPVIHAVARVVGVPPSGNTDEAMLFQALLSPEMSNATLLLPAEGNFTGWSMYILSSDGKHALTLAGEIIKLDGRHRDDGNLQPDLSRLPESRLAGTLLVTRGDGTGMIEMLEATFMDHVLVHDRDGSTRVYSGLRGTFTPLEEDGLSVATAYTNCRTAGQRLVEKGNLRIDTATIGAVGATAGLALVPQVFQNLRALFGSSCR